MVCNLDAITANATATNMIRSATGGATGTASAGYPGYTNGTTPTYNPPGAAEPTLEVVPSFTTHAAQPSVSPLETNSGNKIFAFSGASLAALVGVAAFIL